MGRFSNISVERYRRILAFLGLKYVRTSGGHEMWFKDGMYRNVVFQTHIDPIPELIVKNNIRTIGISSAVFEEALKKIK